LASTCEIEGTDEGDSNGQGWGLADIDRGDETNAKVDVNDQLAGGGGTAEDMCSASRLAVIVENAPVTRSVPKTPSLVSSAGTDLSARTCQPAVLSERLVCSSLDSGLAEVTSNALIVSVSRSIDPI